MIMKVEGVKDARKDLLRLVREGKLVLVTWHGRPRSVLMPLRDIRKLPRQLRMEFLEQTGQELEEHLRKIGASEQQLLEEFKVLRKVKRAARGRR